MLTPSPVRIAHRARIAAAGRRLSLSQQAVPHCATANPGHEAVLLTVLEDAVAHRETQRRTRLLSRAGFPVLKTLAADDRHRVTLPSPLPWGDVETGAVIDAHRNLVLYGAVGTETSHLATALGVQACEQGRAVGCLTVTDLVMRLSAARRAGTVARVVQEGQRADWLLLDEGGYVPVDREGAQLRFRILADRYETRRLLLTTNREFSTGGGLFTDDQMAAARMDRLAHHGHLVLFPGESYRMTHALMTARCGGPPGRM